MTISLSEAVLSAVESVVTPPAALHEPEFDALESEYVLECLDSTFVSSVGPFVERFERLLAEFVGAERAVAVVNGTAALQVALGVVGVVPGDEVLVPALTFVATANAVTYCGAVPHFTEHNELTLGLDPEPLRSYLAKTVTAGPDGGPVNRRTGRPIRACVPMHTFGHPVDLDPLLEVCEHYGIAIVEDAAESLGSWYGDRHTGTIGRAASLSFNGNKIITTGGGGAIVTDDHELADLAKHLTTTARRLRGLEYAHDLVGYNYRMPNLNAALGCGQMSRLEGFVERKRSLADRYRAAFADVENVDFVDEPAGCRSNYWLNTVLLARDHAVERDEILAATNASGFMTRPAWTLMPDLPMYGSCPSMDIPVARSLQARIINLPSSARL